VIVNILLAQGTGIRILEPVGDEGLTGLMAARAYYTIDL
jgi:hypothetical protein